MCSKKGALDRALDEVLDYLDAVENAALFYMETGKAPKAAVDIDVDLVVEPIKELAGPLADKFRDDLVKVRDTFNSSPASPNEDAARLLAEYVDSLRKRIAEARKA